ncbi:MAG: FAD-dependent oxidoreductase [Thermoanaerobaculia bacterium]|nr:FAD-dependent oxidoreductase [Thermoanaerobaculia bacterium]
MKDLGQILVIGAGPTGLGVATRLTELGYPTVRVLESRGAVGGLAASHVDPAGFTWDIGGHVHHSHYTRFDELLDRVLPGGWFEHQRVSRIRMSDRWIPFPFQLNLHRLEPADRDLCLARLEEAADRPLPQSATFAEWIRSVFGDGIAELFLIPYNEKVWGYPLERLGTGWMGDRVARPDLEAIRAAIREDRDLDTWGPNRTFRFPRTGGTGSLWSAVAERLPDEVLELGATVKRIDLNARQVRLADGRRLSWDRLVSSMPLDRLCRRCDGLPDRALETSAQLVSSAVHILGVGLRGKPPESLRHTSWMYFPGSNSPYYRVTVFSNYSPSHVPDATCWSLMAEVCETNWRPVDPATLRSWTLRALEEDGLTTEESEVVSFWHHRESFGYPTPFVGRDAVLQELLPELERHEVYSRGRFGAWKYEVSNQDHCFMQGVELVDRWMDLGEEVTIHQPSVVNRGPNR